MEIKIRNGSQGKKSVRLKGKAEGVFQKVEQSKRWKTGRKKETKRSGRRGGPIPDERGGPQSGKHRSRALYQLSKDIFLGLKNARFCLKRFKSA